MEQMETVYQRTAKRKSGRIGGNRFELEINGEVVFRQFRRAKMSEKEQAKTIINRYALKKRDTHWALFLTRGSNVNKIGNREPKNCGKRI